MAVEEQPLDGEDRWIERAEENWGAWGALYQDDDGKLLGSIQYGPAQLFHALPSSPPAGVRRRGARHVRLPRLQLDAVVEQSLFLAAIGEARDKGAAALEAFAYRYPRGESIRALPRSPNRLPARLSHRLRLPTGPHHGRVELLRLELGGLQPVAEGKRTAVLRIVKEAFAPAPVPQRP